VSIVIPPWNGQFGKYLRSKAEGVDARHVDLSQASSQDSDMVS
jgi:hypothetical protein